MISPKEIIRKEIKSQLLQVSRKEFRSQGTKVAKILKSSAIWKRFNTVFLFVSMDLEIDTEPLLELALKSEKKVFAPALDLDKLIFYRVFSSQGPWQMNRFGIREPLPTSVPGTNDFPALIITPGLAFDRQARRLGRGGGYYDRFFAELDNSSLEYYAMGLCMDFQLIDKVPADENDKNMHGILTSVYFP